jgi:type II secretion system protein J
MEHWRELGATFARMESDLSNTIIGFDPSSVVNGGFHTASDADGSVRFDLVRLLPEDADQGLQRIGYRCTGKALTRLVWPDVNNPALAPVESTLLDGLRSCGFRYLDASGQWLPGWPPQIAFPLPRALEISVGEPDGSTLRRVLRLQ